MFEWLASVAPARVLAWDCATGSGQAARGLADHFNRVIATDASRAQLAHAEPHRKIEYRIASAEESGIESRSVDVITVAQALHWLDRDRFYAEARRVLGSRGILAVWGYGDPAIEGEDANRIVHKYNRGTIEKYWLPERQLLLDGFRTIDFPFAELDAPPFSLERQWSLTELCGYLRTWSATLRYATEIAADPVDQVESDLARVWGDPSGTRLVSWPLFMRVGTVE